MGLLLASLRVCQLELDLDQWMELNLVSRKVLN